MAGACRPSSNDGVSRIWDAATGAVLDRRTGYSPILRGAWSPAGRDVAVLNVGHTVVLRDLDACEVLAELEGHTQNVLWGSLSPDERLLATASDDGTARIWDVSDLFGPAPGR